jgi:glycosyltransferase involved in cell wall biosynthesis
MATLADHSPRLSIGLPVYNGENFLSQALDSLLAQTFRDFEIIVSDNASTDRTPQIGQSYVRRDPRIRYMRNPRNLGAVPNWNRVFELSKAPLFKWAAHDDMHHETYLERCIQLLEDHPDAILAHSSTALIDENGELFPFDSKFGTYLDPKTGLQATTDGAEIGDRTAAIERFWQVLSRSRMGTHIFGVVRRRALEQTRLHGNFYTGDRALLAELALFGRFRACPERLFLKRLHSNVSWTLNSEEQKSYLSTNGHAYSRRARQLEAFFSAPRGKPIGIVAKFICILMVATHCVKKGCQLLIGSQAREAARKSAWRYQSEVQQHEALQ